MAALTTAIGFILALAAPAWSIGEEWKLVVRVTGTVESQQAGASDWTGIWESRLLQDGAKARTLADSRAKIRLADQTVISVGANTQVEVANFKLTPTSRTAQINLLSGKIRVNVGKFTGKENKFQVTTPNAVLAAKGTDFYVDQEKVTKQGIGGGTFILVFDGQVNVNTGGGFFTLFPGMGGYIGLGGVFFINPNAVNEGGVNGGGGDNGGGDNGGGDSDLSDAGGNIEQPPDLQSVFGSFVPSGPPGTGDNPGPPNPGTTGGDTGTLTVDIQ